MTRTRTATATVTKTETALARAEKFLAKENFIEALRELERSSLAAQRPDIGAKISMCKERIKTARVSDLSRRARRHLARGKLRKALGCFEEAHALAPDAALGEQIEMIRARLGDATRVERARTAERSGDFATAARLYGQATTAANDAAVGLRQAQCLVRAGNYRAAVEAFDRLQPTESAVLYDKGLALAHVGRAREALQVWLQIDSRVPAFVEQRLRLFDRAARDVLACFDAGGDPAGSYVEAQYLADHGYEGRHARAIASIIEQCADARAETLWSEGRFEECQRMVQSTAQITPRRLAILAKCTFKHAEVSKDCIEDFAAYWLTALKCDEILEMLSPGDDRDPIVDLLLAWGQALVEQHAGGRSSDAERARDRWRREWGSLCELKTAVGDRADGVLVGTPRFAEIAGNSEQVLDLIRSCRDHFGSEERFLEIGSAYSAAGPSLRRLDAGQYAQAMAQLPRDGDALVSHGIRKVRFGFGLWCLESGTGKPAVHFEQAHELLAVTPDLERTLVERVAAVEGRDKLQRYEQCLATIHRKHPSPQLGKALALVMTRRAIAGATRNQTNMRVALDVVNRALALDPENEEARLAQADLGSELELSGLDRALARNKMNRACALAAESTSAEAREMFFDHLRMGLAMLEVEAPPRAARLASLVQVEEWCCRVDKEHPLRYQVAREIDRLTA